MKLYPKKLHSLEELKREKHVLKYAIQHNDSDNFLSMGGGKGKKKKAKKEEEQDTDTDPTNWLAVAGDLLTSKNTADIAMTMGLPLLKMFGIKAGKRVLMPIAKELLGGYVKWKLVEIGYKTTMRFIRSKQQKHGAHS